MEDKKSHRKRVKRYNIPNHAHELTFSCFRKLPLLTNDRMCGFLADAIIQACEKQKFKMISYVFMPTHVHLIVMPVKESYSISDLLKSVKQPVARREISYLKRNEPDKLEMLSIGGGTPGYRIWMMGGGYDRNIMHTDHLENSINYLHNNPVRKGLVKNVLDWKWSSVRDWQQNEKGIIPIEKDLLF